MTRVYRLPPTSSWASRLLLVFDTANFTPSHHFDTVIFCEDEPGDAAAVGIHLHNHVSTARSVEFELSSSQVTAAAVL